MPEMDQLDLLFIITALVFQSVLVIHFALRKWRFEQAIRYGWLVYALSLPAVSVSVVLLAAGKPWWMWLGGFLYLVWAAFGYFVEYVPKIEWRSPIRPNVFAPYIILYLATVMFYWWPLARVDKTLWFVAAGLFAVSTVLNITSHRRSG